jgi:hypothetical protein
MQLLLQALDLAGQASIQRFAQELPEPLLVTTNNNSSTIDVSVNSNAGIMPVVSEAAVYNDGVEKHMYVKHLTWATSC